MNRRFIANPSMKKVILYSLIVVFSLTGILWAQAPAARHEQGQKEVQFVFLADPHYGNTKKAFQGAKNVDATIVNQKLVEKLNGISAMTFASDTGVNAGKVVGPIDFVTVAGDISSRQEGTASSAVQPAAVSWAQFKHDYLEGVTLLNRQGNPTDIFLLPGNNDVSNAIGFYKPMYPPTDATVMAEIYNREMNPRVPRTPENYYYVTDKIHYSFDLGGIHFVFVSIWPDSAEREWMRWDLMRVHPYTPVVLITHDQLGVEPRHFTNPNGSGDINATDKFENLLVDRFEDGTTIDGTATIEQAELERFLKWYPNVTLHFHGHDHTERYSDWTGPNNSVVVHSFGADSPMKGVLSSTDETKLSFLIVTIDTEKRLATVRECLWNATPTNPSAPIVWNDTITVAMDPRPFVPGKWW